VVPQDAVHEGLRAFGYRAQKEVIEIAEARRLADQLCLSAWWSGETGQGCIGAMAGAGLRSTGNDGRFIGLDGIRDLNGVLSVGEVIRQTAIQRVASVSGETLGDHEAIDTLGWVRPSLRDGKATLYVVRDGTRWRPAEKRKGKG
jgi:hypothetical protein